MRPAWRGFRCVLILVLAVGLVGVAGLGALAWRLGQGPIDVGWLVPHLEERANAGRSVTLAVGGAQIAWAGWSQGAGSAIELHLTRVALHGPAGRTLAQIAAADVVLSPARLLLGQIAPRAVMASGVQLGLVRAPDGGVSLDLGGADRSDGPGSTPDLTQIVAELARPARLDSVGAPAGLEHLEELRQVRLDRAQIRLLDQGLGGVWRLDVPSLDLLRQPGGGVRGSASATLGYAGIQATLRLDAELQADGGTMLRVAMAPVAANAVQSAMTEAGIAPQAAARLDAPVQGTAMLRLSPALLPEEGSVTLGAGAGQVLLAGAPVRFETASIEATASWLVPGWTSPSRVTLGGARVVVRPQGTGPPTQITLSGEATRPTPDPASRIAVTARLALDRLAFADLPALWPEKLGGNVRPWIVQNVTNGTARDGVATVSLDVSADLADIRLVSVDGRLVGDDTSIWWLRPVPPVERAQAVLTMRAPDRLEIAVASGRQGSLTLKDGLIRITGLDQDDQALALTADIAGPVPDLIALLRHPRLRLLDRHPLPARNPGGSFAGKLMVSLPLVQNLEFDDVRMGAQGRFSDLRLLGLVAGRDLERGDMSFDVTTDGLKLAGTAAIAAIPAELSVELDFRGGPPSQVVQQATASGRATARQLAGAGLDTGGLIDAGFGRFVARYRQRRDDSGDIQVTADLKDAGMALAGWTKAPGVPATASARVQLRGEQMLGIDQITARAPGLAVDGKAEMVAGRPLILNLERLTLGATRATGQVRFPATPSEPIRATLDGPTLDLSTELARQSTPNPDPTPGQRWIADARFDRVLLGGERFLPAVTAHAEHDGRRLSVLQARTGGVERLEVSIRPDGGGRRLLVHAADGGAVLRALDVLGVVRGGVLAVNAVFDDTRPGSPLYGSAELNGFHVLDAPILGKLLQAVTVYGVVEALSGPGLAFSQLVMPFRYDGSVLEILNGGRAFSASLGLTGQGRIDVRRNTMDMTGTVVPAYVLNSLLGRIPVLGRLFSAETGGGLVAVDYTLRGPAANPSVSVNPLSALTPGFLRGIFKLF